MATGKKQIILLDEFKKMQKFRDRINRSRLKDLEFYDGAKRIRISKSRYDGWRYTGMNNVDFIQFVVLEQGWKYS